MATALIGAVLGAALAGATATTVTAGVLLGGAAMGAMAGSAFDKPDMPSAPGQVAAPTDKTTAERVEQLDALEIGDKSEKRKRQGSKSKFKIPATSIGENTGVSFKGSKKATDKAITGVQL